MAAILLRSSFCSLVTQHKRLAIVVPVFGVKLQTINRFVNCFDSAKEKGNLRRVLPGFTVSKTP